MTQEEHDKYQAEYRECCMLLGCLNEKQMSAILTMLQEVKRQNTLSDELQKWINDEISSRKEKLKNEMDEDGVLSRYKIESYKTGLYYFELFKSKVAEKNY